MKKIFEEPAIEIELFSTEDIMDDSGNGMFDEELDERG